MFEERFFINEIKDIIIKNDYDIIKYKKLSKEEKRELISKFKDIALYHSFCGMMVNEENFVGYLKHSKFDVLLSK